MYVLFFVLLATPCVASLLPRPARLPLLETQPDPSGHYLAALQSKLLLGGVAACTAWRFAMRGIRFGLQQLRVWSFGGVSSKKLGKIFSRRGPLTMASSI